MNDKIALESQVYDLKMTLANKNLEIQNLDKGKKKGDQRPKSPEKMTQEKFEERLTKIRLDYERKEKKNEKLVQNK